MHDVNNKEDFKNSGKFDIVSYGIIKLPFSF